MRFFHKQKTLRKYGFSYQLCDSSKTFPTEPNHDDLPKYFELRDICKVNLKDVTCPYCLAILRGSRPSPDEMTIEPPWGFELTPAQKKMLEDEFFKP